jgi:hypothetical protein
MGLGRGLQQPPRGCHGIATPFSCDDETLNAPASAPGPTRTCDPRLRRLADWGKNIEKSGIVTAS